MQTPSIREATPADCGIIFGFVRELADFEKLGHEVVATEELFYAALFGPSPCAEAVVAERDGKTVGFALFFTSFSTFLGRSGLYLEDLYVPPSERGKGTGLALLRHLAVLAQGRGCGRFEWSVLDWNARAIAFYESLGAKPVPGWTRYRMESSEIAALASARPN